MGFIHPPKYEIKADKRIPLVNLADRIAYQFNIDLIKNENTNLETNLIGKYFEHRIYPKLDKDFTEYFTEYFRKQEEKKQKRKFN